MNFHETKMGQRFFDQQLPQLIQALQDITKVWPQITPTLRLPEQEAHERDILSSLYNGLYMPESIERKKDNPFDQNTRRAMDALLDTLSSHQKELFYQYEVAENTRSADTAERAYRDGVQFTVQLILAGYAISE